MGWLLGNTAIGTVTWFGTILAIIGLVLTFIQARGARAAAESAADAAKKAVHLLEGKANLVNLAFAYAQIGLVKNLVQNESLQAAQMVFHGLRRQILESLFLLRHRAYLRGEIRVIQQSLETVERQLDRGLTGSPTYNRQHIIRALSGVAVFLASREQEIKHSTSELQI